MHVKSKASKETYGWLGSNTRFREWVGPRVMQNLKTHDFTIKNISFENTVSVDRDDIEDDNIGVYAPMIQQLGQDAAMHPDELVFSLLADAFDKECYDGQYFVDTDHPVIQADGSVASVSNDGGGSGSAWFLLDTTKFVKPLIFQERKGYNFVAKDNPEDDNVFKNKEFVYGVDARCNVGFGLWQLIYGSKQTLDATNYKAARAAMLGFKGDGGKPLNVTPNLLVVGPANEGAAKEITVAERAANGATNIHRGTAEVLVVPWL